MQISITYGRRGTIRAILFNHSDNQPVVPSSELGALLQQSVKDAMAKMRDPGRKSYVATVEGLHLSPRFYRGNSFEIEPISRRRFKLSLTVLAFDKVDAEPEFVRKMKQVLNVLSVETNSAFWPLDNSQTAEDEPISQKVDTSEMFSPDPDWIDGCPLQDEQLLISRESVALLDLIAGDAPGVEDIGRFLRACNHFHIARKYAAQLLDLLKLSETRQVSDNEYVMSMIVRDPRLEIAGKMADAHAEISGTLFMSAMEVAARIGVQDPESCGECGQVRYKISQRVTDLMERCGGEHLASVSKDYYSQRSKYLHEGVMLSESNYTGVSIPQLDPSSPTGCLLQTTAPSPNLRDYVGFCLRKVLKEIVTAVC